MCGIRNRILETNKEIRELQNIKFHWHLRANQMCVTEIVFLFSWIHIIPIILRKLNRLTFKV